MQAGPGVCLAVADPCCVCSLPAPPRVGMLLTGCWPLCIQVERGKAVKYCYTENELQRYLARTGLAGPQVNIQRFKGESRQDPCRRGPGRRQTDAAALTLRCAERCPPWSSCFLVPSMPPTWPWLTCALVVCGRAGLGEMMPQQLWDTTLDPLKRMLKKLTVEEAAEANSMFSLLMGDKVSDKRFFPTCFKEPGCYFAKPKIY
jgi:hypothetical protein